jgi:hypothetical protein
LSAEKTPTLWCTLPAFNGLIIKLQQLQKSEVSHLAPYEVIECGIEKLKKYKQETTTVPAHTLSLCK